MIKRSNITPHVSVIVPIYGVEQYIEKCARSLFEQTLESIEYIFIDDCTPDHSMNILKSVLKEYPHRQTQAKILHNESNRGQAWTRAYGISESTGEYVIHCDPDDWVDVNAYEIMYETAIRASASIVRCNFYRVESGYTEQANYPYHRTNRIEILSDMFAEKTMASLWSTLVRGDIARSKSIVTPTHNFIEDFTLLVQYFLQSEKNIFLEEALYYYNYNPDSIVNKRGMDATMSRYESYKANAEIIHQVLIKTPYWSILKQPFFHMLEYKHNILLPYLNYKQNRRIWIDEDKEYQWEMLFSSYVSRKYKIRYVLVKLRIYSLFLIFHRLCRK
jgi:glycosyltransferase involved in cell wall biosynthesis